jgi:hypothetical protein
MNYYYTTDYYYFTFFYHTSFAQARGERRSTIVSIYTYDISSRYPCFSPLPHPHHHDLEAPNNPDVDKQHPQHDGRGRGRGDVSSFNEVGFDKS